MLLTSSLLPKIPNEDFKSFLSDLIDGASVAREQDGEGKRVRAVFEIFSSQTIVCGKDVGQAKRGI